MSFMKREYSSAWLCLVAEVDGGCLRITVLRIWGREEVCVNVLNYQVDMCVYRTEAELSGGYVCIQN
jgi:hypothetical protein